MKKCNKPEANAMSRMINKAQTLLAMERNLNSKAHGKLAPFAFMSTNKVYGDAANELPLVELEKRWDFANEEDREGIDENCRIDQSKHSLFGASKAATDFLTQEYGRYFGLPHTAREYRTAYYDFRRK